MNKAIIMGRLTRDPDVRYSQGNGDSMAIARYTLAIDRRGSKNDGEQKADFIPCVAFGKAGEFAEKYFHQGLRVLVSGRIQTGSYTNKEGQRIYTTEVIAESQEFADGKGNSSSENTTVPRIPDQTDAEGFLNIPDGVEDEGLPFN